MFALKPSSILRIYRVLFMGIALICSQAIILAQGYHSTTGLYGSRRPDFQLTQNVSFGASVLYYFGDADGFSNADKNGTLFSTENIGASVNVAFHQPVSKHCSMRYTGVLGTLRGNNKEAWAKIPSRGQAYRKFNSVFIQPAIGVECFPIDDYGFFLYGGIAGAISFLVNAEYCTETGTRLPKNPSLTVFLPMAQVSLGYTWPLSNYWQISAHAMFEMGFVPDSQGINLDGWPLNNDKNSKADRWPDGWFELGISAAYILNDPKAKKR